LDVNETIEEDSSLKIDPVNKYSSETNCKIDKNKIMDIVFEQIKKENRENELELQNEFEELLKREEILLKTEQSSENESEDESENQSENESEKDNVTELYEKRIEYRQYQDNILVNDLENLHLDIDITKNNENRNINKSNREAIENCQENNRKRGFFELMHSFIENTDWLHHTDVACWWCCHKFDTVPIGLPIRFNIVLKKFHVKGIFCSFSCMVAYKNEKPYKDSYLIKYLYNKLTGTLLTESTLSPAPPRCSLKMFGGELTIDEFRNSFQENKIYKMIEYPMFVCKDYIEEIDIQNLKRVNQNVFLDSSNNNNLIKSQNLDEKRIQDAKTRLSQIEQSTVHVGNTIDRFIKIS
jgi:hypothetical protein